MKTILPRTVIIVANACAGLQHATLKLTVLVPWRVGHRKKVIGCVELGSSVEPLVATKHWAEMLANPRRPVASWHQLAELIREWIHYKTTSLFALFAVQCWSNSKKCLQIYSLYCIFGCPFCDKNNSHRLTLRKEVPILPTLKVVLLMPLRH